MATLPTLGASRVICVSGMHRSGTSLAARLVQILGVSLGSSDHLLDPGPDNTAGYWEHAAIKELDDEILASLGGSWDQLPLLSPGWEDAASLDRYRDQARRALEDTFAGADAPIIGFKDPRLSVLLPFWRTVVDVDSTIVLVRDPVEVVGSLAKRNGFSAAHTSLLWLRYLLAATESDPGHLLVTQTEIFGDLPGTMARIASHLGLPAPTSDMLEEAAAHLDPDLRHHTAAAQAEPEGGPIGEIAASVWNSGRVTLDDLTPGVRSAVAQGWLRDPGDAEALMASRAEVVALTEEIRGRNRERDATLSWRLRLQVRRGRAWLRSRNDR